MKLSAVVTIAAMSILAVSGPVSAADKTAVPQKNVCKPGELGGIVASNKKLADGSYRTIYIGSKAHFDIPANAKEEFAKVAKLKAGDTNCFADDGS